MGLTRCYKTAIF